MGEEAFQTEGPQGRKMGHTEGGCVCGWGARCWAAVQDAQQGGEGEPQEVATWVRRGGYRRVSG